MFLTLYPQGIVDFCRNLIPIMFAEVINRDLKSHLVNEIFMERWLIAREMDVVPGLSDEESTAVNYMRTYE